MIFVTVGSQKFQFNRLLAFVDDLLDHKIIEEEVFAQTGYSDYQPRNYKYQAFLDREEYHQKMHESEIVITHGGTGAIMGAVKEGKWVIAVPRLCIYGEHVDDHQEQVVFQLINERIIIGVKKLEDMKEVIGNCRSFAIPKYKSNTQEIIESIDQFITDLT